LLQQKQIPPKISLLLTSLSTFSLEAKYDYQNWKKLAWRNFQVNIFGLQHSFWPYPACTILLVTCFSVLSNPSFQSLQMELIPWQGMKMTLWL
jgi:hypothetical protein